MIFAFRTDASNSIGSGHVMRCLTLAQKLRERGHYSLFLCRNFEGHLADVIMQNGFELHLLTRGTGIDDLASKDNCRLLGFDCDADVRETAAILETVRADWLIVDHYGIDAKWEAQVAKLVSRIMVIDDLANRNHYCQILLDQTLGRIDSDYSDLIISKTLLLCGPQYALLRREFAELRESSLKRRATPSCSSSIVSLGGTDDQNLTQKVLKGMKQLDLSHTHKTKVILGSKSRWIESVSKFVSTLPWDIEVLVGVEDMAKLMTQADFAIGAGGMTSWERCCLGLPSAILVLADNQLHIAKSLQQARAAYLIRKECVYEDVRSFFGNLGSSQMHKMSNAGAAIVDGAGADRVVMELENFTP